MFRCTHWRFMDEHDRHIALSAPPPPPKPFLRKSAHSVVCVTFRNSFDVGGATGAARRRQRRLRQSLRHERLSVAMAFAESQHHTPRGQKMARAGGRGTRCTTRPSSGQAPLSEVAGWQVTGSAASHGFCRHVAGTSFRACTRCSCAADGGSVAGH